MTERLTDRPLSQRAEAGRFAVGHSGNPGGRPAETLFRAVQRELQKLDDVAKKTGYEKAAVAIAASIIEADSASVAMVMDREDPKVVRNVNVDVAAWNASMDSAIEEMQKTEEGMARLAEMQRESLPAPSTEESAEHE